MPVDLSKPLAWTSADPAEVQMLKNLQGNILKGHGRNHTANLFFLFDPKEPEASLRFLRDLATNHLTDAFRQLDDARAMKASGRDGGPFLHLALSRAGYEAIGHGSAAPRDEAFTNGLKASREALHDGELSAWEPHFRDAIHGLIIVGDDDAVETGAVATSIADMLKAAGGTVVTTQLGHALRGPAGTPFEEGIEHFGYVDGRSQPLLLAEDVAREPSIGRWDPTFPLDLVLVPDPGAPDDASFGSYLVFRKLEQNVRAFKTREQEIADALRTGAPTMDRELAGALIVGRFEDGTPVTLRDSPQGAQPPNDFDYATDAGFRCPVQAHIRKTNPRGAGGGEATEEERRHLMVRRGIPFTDVERAASPFELPEAETFEEFKERVQPLLPTGGVGLLFMAYNRDLGAQFEFTQKLWANNTNFPFAPPGPHGIDPVIGQGANLPRDQKLPVRWDDASAGSRDDLPFSGFVTMRGGEYFFSPSLTFLRSLGREATV
ncbi:Dyp-type peroxidase [Methylobacterium oxalidis]|uniref:Dyp-type peroxidase n=1 Tax=Methylobacterium oxalidis TaxID=944322 RepID=UPI0033150DBB